MLITLPPNIVVSGGIKVSMNNKTNIKNTYESETRTLRLYNSVLIGKNDVKIESGLKNPDNGSYSYTGIMVEVLD